MSNFFDRLTTYLMLVYMVNQCVLIGHLIVFLLNVMYTIYIINKMQLILYHQLQHHAPKIHILVHITYYYFANAMSSIFNFTCINDIAICIITSISLLYTYV